METILTIGNLFSKLWYIHMWEYYTAISNYIFKEQLRCFFKNYNKTIHILWI